MNAPKKPAKSGAKKKAGGITEPDHWIEGQWTLEELNKNVEPYAEIWTILT